MEPKIRSAFTKGMTDIKDRAQMGRLRDALRDNDIALAIDSLIIDPAAMSDLQARIVETYGKTGEKTISGQTWRYPDGTRAVVRWNMLSPQAEEYARNVSGQLIQGINDDTIQAARDTIADGYALGRPTDRIARDLVGRIGPNGRRQGGVVGLDQQSKVWVHGGYVTRNGVTVWQDGLRQHLETDPTRALRMKLNARDKAFIRRLGDKRLTQAQIDNIVRRYENNLLMVRGRRIARTETRNAIESAKYEAWRQGLEKTGIPEEFLVRTWVHTGRAMFDRPWHQSFSGTSVRGLNVPFVLSSGAALLHPHDTSYGAGAREVIQCECRCDYEVDRKGLKEWYEGRMG